MESIDKLDELVAAHPRLFRGKPPVVSSYLSSGWFAIVDDLCRDIDALLGSEPERFEVRQIKEKFGGLRFYFALEDAEDMFVDIQANRDVQTLVVEGDGPALMGQIRALVEAASLRSETTCEDCGAPGVRAARNGWIGTLCEVHARERGHPR